MSAPPVEPETEIDFDPNGPHRCRDFDEDCFGLDHLHCWLYDPTQGICPFLSQSRDKPK